MTSLLEIREYIKNFYIKFEIYKIFYFGHRLNKNPTLLKRVNQRDKRLDCNEIFYYLKDINILN